MGGRQVPPELVERPFEIAIRRLADELSFGSDLSRYYGQGVEYAQSRPYEPGDAVSSIDWRLTARKGEYYVKEYEALRSTPIQLLLDTSASMAFQSTPVSKFTMAVQIAGGLAFAALRRLSPVGIHGCGERPLRYSPSLSRGQLLLWLQQLRRTSFNEDTLLAVRIKELRKLVQTRTVVVILSDLHDPDAIAEIKRLAQQHEVIVLQLQDPAERGRLKAGFVRAAEAETNRQFIAHSKSHWFDHARAAPAASELSRAGIDHLLLPTNRPFVPILRRFLKERDGLWKGRP